MSVLEIGNRLRDCTDRAQRRVRPSLVLGDAARTEDAMTDWARKYPGDPWLPHYWWRLATLYSLIPTYAAHGRERAALVRYRRYARAR